MPRPQNRSAPPIPSRTSRCFRTGTGRRTKNIRGKLFYFGPWSDADEHLQKYRDQRDDPDSRPDATVQGDDLTIRDLRDR